MSFDPHDHHFGSGHQHGIHVKDIEGNEIDMPDIPPNMKNMIEEMGIVGGVVALGIIGGIVYLIVNHKKIIGR